MGGITPAPLSQGLELRTPEDGPALKEALRRLQTLAEEILSSLAGCAEALQAVVQALPGEGRVERSAPEQKPRPGPSASICCTSGAEASQL